MRTRVPVTVRASEVPDAPFIRDLGRAAFEEYSSHAERDTVKMAREAPTLIAVKDGERVGLAIVEISGQDAHLAAIAVVETARGVGVGAALLEAAERLARTRGCRFLSLTTADSNLAALDLFFKRGFRQKPRSTGRYSRGQRTIDLVKKL